MAFIDFFALITFMAFIDFIALITFMAFIVGALTKHEQNDEQHSKVSPKMVLGSNGENYHDGDDDTDDG